MAKIKTSISLDERLLADLDNQAKADGVSRSELIERLCRRSLSKDPKVEVVRFQGMPTAIVPLLSSMSWHDEDGPVELVIRVATPQWEEWCRKGPSESVRNLMMQEGE
ncbi:MAG: ribbon-helix-helix domain-containing protein [Phycisphaerales bacterium]|nr:ribbon-helix-helix protein, CopG family [Planctomycetota bacterium]MCH8508884.1 ribbon-helix-helix domain-containing protein [Phycisphaerales bacterium]